MGFAEGHGVGGDSDGGRGCVRGMTITGGWTERQPALVNHDGRRPTPLRLRDLPRAVDQ